MWSTRSVKSADAEALDFHAAFQQAAAATKALFDFPASVQFCTQDSTHATSADVSSCSASSGDTAAHFFSCCVVE